MSGRDTSMNEIWILGATGRAGRSIAAQLAARHVSPVLVGRDQTRLRELAGTIGGTPRVLVAGSVDAIVTELARATPAVVINTIGPFMETALPIAGACPAGTHYVDLANELLAVTAVLGLHGQAVAAGRSLVTGAGFGVLATESVVLKLCEDRPGAARVRVDAVPMVEAEAGLVGPALAGSLLDGFAVGGRRYQGGRLVRARLGSDVERLTLPDSSAVQTIGVPTGELEAAGRASGAPFAVAASSEVPSGRAIRAILPAVAAVLSLPALRNVAKRRLARVRVGPSERRREFSWAHARVEWPDGSIREGWLRAGEGMAFTAAVAAEVASRLGRNEGRPGAYTPGSLFGPDLAADAGGQFILEESLAR